MSPNFFGRSGCPEPKKIDLESVHDGTMNKPEVEKSIALTPKRIDSFVYFATSRSARRSKSRHDESSGDTKITKMTKYTSRSKMPNFLLLRCLGFSFPYTLLLEI